MYYKAHIHPLTSHQISRLLNGHTIQVKPVKSGGHELMLHKDQMKKHHIAFNHQKAYRITFVPEQISMHQHLKVKKEGKGIFGKKFDRAVKKAIGKSATKAIYKGLETTRPLVNKAIDIGAKALITAQPELAPAIMAGSEIAKGYIAKPTEYQENPENFAISGLKGLTNYGVSEMSKPQQQGGAVLPPHHPFKKIHHKSKQIKKVKFNKGGALYPA